MRMIGHDMTMNDNACFNTVITGHVTILYELNPVGTRRQAQYNVNTTSVHTHCQMLKFKCDGIGYLQLIRYKCDVITQIQFTCDGNRL